MVHKEFPPMDGSNMTTNKHSPPAQEPSFDGITVIGEAVRRVSAETAEFVAEVATNGLTAAQALQANQQKLGLFAEALAPFGVQSIDVTNICATIQNVLLPMQAAPGIPNALSFAQFGHPYLAAALAQPDIQPATLRAACRVRVCVRDSSRAGEVIDAAIRAGATLATPLTVRASDEALARRSALEAAAKDARAKAEALAAAAGKQLGDPVAISEESTSSNGAGQFASPYFPGMFTPDISGELEFRARVSARFRFH